MSTLGRLRLSCGSGLVQPGEWQPIIGTPALVPVPRKRSSMSATRDGYRAEIREFNGGPGSAAAFRRWQASPNVVYSSHSGEEDNPFEDSMVCRRGCRGYGVSVLARH